MICLPSTPGRFPGSRLWDRYVCRKFIGECCWGQHCEGRERNSVRPKWAAMQSRGLNWPCGECGSWDGPSELSPGLWIPALLSHWMWVSWKGGTASPHTPSHAGKKSWSGGFGWCGTHRTFSSNAWLWRMWQTLLLLCPVSTFPFFPIKRCLIY